MLYKLIFSILLILNLGLFALGYQRPPPQFPPPPVPPPLEATNIQLVSELAQPTPPSQQPAIPVPICVRLGPVYVQKDTLDLATMLENVGQTIEVETETMLQNGGFWLVIAAKKDKTETIMAQLNSAGVMDVWVFDEGPLQGMISLGLYSKHADAEKRRTLLQRKGFNPEIRPREIEVTNYWVTTNYVESNTAVQTVMEKIHELYPHLTSPSPSCKNSLKN